MKLIQADLIQDDKLIAAWIDQTKNLKEGSKVTLKGKSGWWLVKKLYPVIRESTELSFKENR